MILMKSIGIFWKETTYKSNDNKDAAINNLSQHQLLNKAKEDIVNQKSDIYSDKTFDLQINLWNTEIKRNGSYAPIKFQALDLGLVCPLTTKEITFLFPFKVDAPDFQDLASVLAGDNDLLCTVFNESLANTAQSDKDYNVIECEKFKYIMYKLSNDNIEDIKYDSKSSITQFTIKIISDFSSKNLEAYRLFIRFRLRLRDLGFLAHKRKISNDWLQSAFSSTYMFDIRINDVRELSNKKRVIVTGENQFMMPAFSKVHFYYMADSEETIENGSSMKIDSRLLENDRWHTYLGEGLEFASDNIAHHWKKKSLQKMTLKEIDCSNPQKPNLRFEPQKQSFEDFTLFFKTEFSDINRKRISLYLIIVALLGAISSSFITTLFEGIDLLDKSKTSYVGLMIGSFLTLTLIGLLYFCLTRKLKVSDK